MSLDEKCGWHIMFHRKDSTSGKGMRGYVESDGTYAPAYNCTKCDGYDKSCVNHQDYDPKVKEETKK